MQPKLPICKSSGIKTSLTWFKKCEWGLRRGFVNSGFQLHERSSDKRHFVRTVFTAVSATVRKTLFQWKQTTLCIFYPKYSITETILERQVRNLRSYPSVLLNKGFSWSTSKFILSILYSDSQWCFFFPPDLFYLRHKLSRINKQTKNSFLKVKQDHKPPANSDSAEQIRANMILIKYCFAVLAEYGIFKYNLFGLSARLNDCSFILIVHTGVVERHSAHWTLWGYTYHGNVAGAHES